MRCAYCNSNKFIPRPKSEVWVEFAKAALTRVDLLTPDEAALLADALLTEYEKRFGKV